MAAPFFTKQPDGVPYFSEAYTATASDVVVVVDERRQPKLPVEAMADQRPVKPNRAERRKRRREKR